MADDLRLSLGEARRLAVRSQHLAGPDPGAGPAGRRQVLCGLRVLQLDPVNVVARLRAAGPLPAAPSRTAPP